MTNNLALSQVVASQDNKETTINDQAAELDAKATAVVTKTITSSNAATVTQLEMQRMAVLNIQPDGGDPPGGAILITVDTGFEGGSFFAINDTAQTVTIEVTSQPKTSPTLLTLTNGSFANDGANIRKGV